MKLWKLQAIDAFSDPFRTEPGTVFVLVVRAPTEDAARGLAGKYGGMECGETRAGLYEGYGAPASNPWKDAALTTCEEITTDGPPRVLARVIHTDQVAELIDPTVPLRRN